MRRRGMDRVERENRIGERRKNIKREMIFIIES